MSTNHAQSRSRRLLLLNLAGLAGLAALHPYLRFAESPVLEWAGQLLAALVGAAVLYGAYYLVFRERGRRAWPRGYLMLAWFLVASAVLVPYLNRAEPKASAPVQAQQTRSEMDKFLDAAPSKSVADQRSEMDKFLDAAPAQGPGAR